MVKPMPIPELVALIREKLKNRGTRRALNTERVASILERDTLPTIADWLARVERDDELPRIVLSDAERTGHLPQLTRELVHRLRIPRSLGTKQTSQGAVEHGKIHRAQGYSIPMIIEESRMLQVSIFQTLQTNLSVEDFRLLLIDVMTIADEVDSQLKQTIVSFTEPPDELRGTANSQLADSANIISAKLRPSLTNQDSASIRNKDRYVGAKYNTQVLLGGEGS